MDPTLVSSDGFTDLVLILRATRYQKNDIVFYINPETGKETFGRLRMSNGSEDLKILKNAVPAGHSWIDNDNKSSKEHDSSYFGPIPSGLIRGYVMARVYPPFRAKVLVT